jgi:mRNA-degrading endonuclease RelE of RelBE toxin-antitoxin system
MYSSLPPLKDQSTPWYGRIRIAVNPELGKPLRGEFRGIYSERVATFRILYKIRKEEVEVLILVIEHRSSVYGGH